jgi:hypothetical protein
MGQRMAVALVALGLGSVIFGLVGFRKHQRDADEIGQLSRQYGSRTELLSPEIVHPSERMARWNLLIWTGVGFTYFGVSLGVAAAMLNRIKQAKADAQAATAAA